jgi:hypothetical protein
MALESPLRSDFQAKALICMNATADPRSGSAPALVPRRGVVSVDFNGADWAPGNSAQQARNIASEIN